MDEKRVNNLFIKLILVRIQYQYGILCFGNNIKLVSIHMKSTPKKAKMFSTPSNFNEIYLCQFPSRLMSEIVLELLHINEKK